MRSQDLKFMARALQIAEQGLGKVEPNPMVGCVIVRDDMVIGEGFHAFFGGPHAEVAALAAARENGQSVEGATMYVTLEPCCHHGKTPPCTSAILDAKLSRVVVGTSDPFKKVDGGGVNQLRNSGVKVEIGILETEAKELVAPYTTLLIQRRPWNIAKWAMTLDGKIATRTGDSQWISGEASRSIVHQLRRRVDAIMVGIETALKDDPLLTARPAGDRVANRIVLDRQARLPLNSQLVRTASDCPLILICAEDADSMKCRQLTDAGCEILTVNGKDSSRDQLTDAFRQLGERKMTNVLVEGGGGVLGALFDAQMIDEVHVFVAPKLVGGAKSLSPVAGLGLEKMIDARRLTSIETEMPDGDLYIRGRLVELA